LLYWRVWISLDRTFCIKAVEEPLARCVKPSIFNTDLGSQFTSTAFTDALKKADIAISMVCRGA
jgi:putative transposase